MKNMYFPFLMTIILSLYVSQNVSAQTAERTLSPYFRLSPDSTGATAKLPLESTDVSVKISGVIADVTVVQRYKNSGNVPVEAVYVFPASTRAAVYSMQMRIGGRTIQAQIKKKDEAKKDYEDARRSGISASLLEQERPNVFTMNVANILPGDIIDVEMKYTELLVPEEKYYSFVFPAIVGPRYKGGAEQPGTDGISPAGARFGMELTINAGMEIEELFSGTHRLDIMNKDAYTKYMKLMDVADAPNDKDIVVKYRLAGDKIRTGLLLSEGEKENFFLLMVQPVRRVKPEMLPDREFVFIVDVSGSMKGFPLDVSRKLFANLAATLKPTDKFNLLLFSGSSEFFAETSMPATKENIKKAVKFLAQEHEHGGTELLPALKRAFDYPDKEGLSRSFVIITDGYVTVEQEAYQLIMDKRNKANVFPFGIGPSINRYIIEGMAKAGGGEPFFVLNTSGADSVADKFLDYIYAPLMTDIKVEFDGFMAYDTEPSSIPDLLAERPILVYGKYRGDATGNIRVSGIADEKYVTDVDVLKFGERENNEALKYLWARNRIAVLDDWAGANAEQNKEKVTELGLSYNLLTKHTSFVAVDSEQRRLLDSLKRVNIGNDLGNTSLADNETIDDAGEGFATGDLMQNAPVSAQAMNFAGGYGGKMMKLSVARDKGEFSKKPEDHAGMATYDKEKFSNGLVFPMFERRRGNYEIDLKAKVHIGADKRISRIEMTDITLNYLEDDIRAAMSAAGLAPQKKNGKAINSIAEINMKMQAKQRMISIMYGGRERQFTELRSGYRVLELVAGSGPKLKEGDNVKLRMRITDGQGKAILENDAQTGSSDVSVLLKEKGSDNPYGRLLIGRSKGTKITVQIDDDLKKELNLADLGGSFLEIEVL